ncbi:class I SAM-dependent methyltransferase [Nocardia farcinica]|uniref:Methyltransferase domain-containing protein n=1 Tax=Nocardia farcinica (strain IFM 10152) TaxID=247156 RepID=Q5Z3N0_NOCFA|nr:methyltransferase domain-containing protein [Nocardia farcinica]MBF6268696.1 methyltransferase domain-containing protein [Nocardia farcinica]BAD54961.1 hypothetical protein NFA_1190 [Nocardia farcinica IFM 10152]
MSAHPFAAPEPWDLVADGYAETTHALLEPFSARALELVAPGPYARVLDVAAGPGTLSLPAARQVAEVAAIDFSEEMVRLLTARARAEGIDNIRATVGDGQRLPFTDDRFDAAFSMFGLMFFPDRRKGFGEMFRVLRPGGVAVVSSWAPVLESTLMRMVFAALRAADPSIQEPQPNYLNLENPEVFATEMREAGFAGVSIQRHTHSVAYADGADLLAQMVRGSAPLTLLRREVGEREWERRAAIMRAHLDEHYRPNMPLTTTALLGIGHKPAA